MATTLQSTTNVVKGVDAITNLTFAGLDNGVEYYIRAKAVTVRGKSLVSANFGPVIPTTAPGKPTIVTVAVATGIGGAATIQCQQLGACDVFSLPHTHALSLSLSFFLSFSLSLSPSFSFSSCSLSLSLSLSHTHTRTLPHLLLLLLLLFLRLSLSLTHTHTHSSIFSTSHTHTHHDGQAMLALDIPRP